MEEVIKDKAPSPPGLLPKNLQAFVLVGIALLMVLIMAVTGHKRPVAAAVGGPPPLPDPLPVNPDKVSDFQKAIEQTQRESAPQVEAALLQQQKQLATQGQWRAQPKPYGTPITSVDPNGAYPPGSYAAVGPLPEVESADTMKEEQKKRQYLSLFADNVALSYRKHRDGLQSPEPNSSSNGLQSTSQAAGTGATDLFRNQDQLLAQAGAQLAREEQLLQQIQQASLPGAGTLPQRTPSSINASEQASDLRADKQPARSTNEKDPNPDLSQPGAVNSATGKNHVLFEGTILEALLINRLDGSFSGPVSCLLSTNVYSHDRQHLLIPAGSKILGEASKVDTFGQVRLAVAFHRLIMPDGYSVNLDQFKGLDQEGTTALKDKVNNHYVKIFGTSLAIGILGGVAQLGTRSVLNSGGADRIREGFGVGMATAGEQILDRFLNILPTVTIREGARVKVYLSNDLLLPEYSAHNMSPNL